MYEIDFPCRPTRMEGGRYDLITMPPSQFLGEYDVPLEGQVCIRNGVNANKCRTYEFTLAIPLERAVLAPLRRVFESCKVEAGTMERHGMDAGGGASIDNSRLAFGRGGIEKCGQKQLCEVERTWWQKALKNTRLMTGDRKTIPRALVPQIMSYPSTVTSSIGPPIMPLHWKVGPIQPWRRGGKNARIVE